MQEDWLINEIFNDAYNLVAEQRTAVQRWRKAAIVVFAKILTKRGESRPPPLWDQRWTPFSAEAKGHR